MNNSVEATNELHRILKEVRGAIKQGYKPESRNYVDVESTIEDLCQNTQKGADLDYLEKERGFSCIPNVFWNERLIQLFIKRGRRVNSQDENGDTALNLSLRYSFFTEDGKREQNAINLLLEHSADPNIPNLQGETALFTLAKDEFKEGLDEESTWELAEMLLDENGADSETQNYDGESLMHLHQQYYCITDGFILRYEGDDVDLRTSPCLYSQTPLMMAARENSRLKCCQLLIKQGANVNAVDLQGYTALHHALMMEAEECAQFLVDSGADPNLKSKSGKDPYELAILVGRKFTYGAEPTKQLELFEMAGAKAILVNLDPNWGFKQWEEGMELCKKFDLTPSTEFLANYQFLNENKDNPNMGHEIYVSAMSTVARLSKGTQESKFWILLACLQLLYEENFTSFFFETLINFSEEFKRVGDFASLEENDFYTLSNLARFFKAWLTRLIVAEVGRKKEVIDHISSFHSIVSLTIACFEKRIQETNSKKVLGIFPSKTRINRISTELYSCSLNSLSLIRNEFNDVIPKTDFECNDKLLRDLINLDLRDREGNNLMHIALKSTGIFDIQTIDTVLDLGKIGLEVMRAKNEMGIDPVQTIYWKGRQSKEQFRKLLVKIAEMGAHVDARNPDPRGGQTLNEILEEGEKFSSFPYDNLQCLCARVLGRSLIPFRNRVPKTIVDFILMHV